MHPAGVAIAVLRNRKARTLLLAILAGLTIAIAIVVVAVVASLQAVLAAQCPVTDTETSGPGTSTYESQEPSKEALADIPANYLEVYRAAAEEYGLDWAFLAAVGKQETDHGEGGKEYTCINSSVGAQGPMQFMPETWASEGLDGNGDGKADPCQYEDAIFSAASYFTNLGAPEDYHGALCSYYGACADANADYANEVLAQAEEYRAAEENGSGAKPAAEEQRPAPSDRSSAASPRGPPEAPSGESAAASPAASPEASAAAASPAAAGEGGGSGVPPNGWDNVDEDREIDYVLETSYASYFEDAAAEWNELGGVETHPSESASDTDLVVTDGYVGGAMAKTFSHGEITFDPSHMDGATENAKLAAAGHELGHALGFPHNEAESVLNSPIVVNGEDNVTAPTAYDEQEYSKVWGSGGGDSSPGDGEVQTGAVFPCRSSSWTPTPTTGARRVRAVAATRGPTSLSTRAPPSTPLTDGVVQETDGSSASHYSEVGGYNIMVKATESVGPIEEGDLLYYAHMKPPGPSVEPGQEVSAGDQIGAVGSTGYGPEVTEGEMEQHLHFGWYTNSDSRAETDAGAMNPYPLLEWLKENGGTADNSDDLAPSPTDAPAYCTSPLARLFGFFTGGGGDSSGTETPPSGGGSPDGGSTSGSGDGQAAVEEAKKYLGVPYVLAGPEGCIPGEQMDCTCLTTTAFEQFGVTLPDDPGQVPSYGEKVTGEPQAGDIHVWGDPGDGTGGHVAIDMGDGNIIHANMVTMDVAIAPMYDSPDYLGAWRIVE
ncbi:peptidoglycan DD-metalloendopeptidase family protein (plasmid) [Rubrobacter tropicus]|uniref:Peptidoglycan DD-metalloendopeptidase family protein n=1 Tax=Rubrobacter tropicus TaxID=2653851 RepID=A0A6G8QG97_9ACTN|nr:lytic murein transglycosylase [Rubrobacter tropicus]QIN85515.1 peptidoglycan DD-metalloendopeptidase family protein [Rubrobacter tropicus]